MVKQETNEQQREILEYCYWTLQCFIFLDKMCVLCRTQLLIQCCFYIKGLDGCFWSMVQLIMKFSVKCYAHGGKILGWCYGRMGWHTPAWVFHCIKVICMLVLSYFSLRTILQKGIKTAGNQVKTEMTSLEVITFIAATEKIPPKVYFLKKNWISTAILTVISFLILLKL